MNRNTLWMVGLLTAFALGGLGAGDCDDPFIEPCEDGEIACEDGSCVPEGTECPISSDCGEDEVSCPDGTCAPTLAECPALGCRDDGTCQPNYYTDNDLGAYNTSSYGLRLFSNGQPGNSSGNIIAVNAFADGEDVYYWLLNEVEEASPHHPVDMFPNEHRVNRVFVFFDEAGEEILTQDPIIEYAADDANNYSPLLQVWKVHVPSGYTANTIKSAATVEAAANDMDTTGIWLEPTGSVIVVEVTAESVGLHRINDIPADWRPYQLEVWKDGRTAHAWFNFLTSHDDGVSVWVNDQDDWSTRPTPWVADLFQFRPCNGRNVYRGLNEPGDLDYSPYIIRHFLEKADGSALSAQECQSTPTVASAIDDALQANTYQVRPNTAQYMVLAQFPQ